MTDYARIYDFASKDGLATGDPAKTIKGSEVDAEFDSLVTVTGTKIDKPSGPSEGDFLKYESGTWTSSAAGITPAGAVTAYAGSSAPTDWLFCDGSSISTTTYAALFTAIGYTYGGSGGSFNLPDLRGRAVFGMDNMDNSVGTGGGDASRLTIGSAAGVDGDTLGDSGGVEEHQLTIAEMPAHTHGTRDDLHTQGFAGGNLVGSDSGGTTDSTGGGGAHTNLPPALVLNYIIYTGG